MKQLVDDGQKYQYLDAIKGCIQGFTNFDFLMEMEIIRLGNGLRVLYAQDTSIVTVHCGFIINAGSRDETDDESGLAHLIEHCLFKGTENRKAFHILSRLDSVGGEINAYTTKEETAIYASALMEHFDRAAELLYDITFSSVFPEKEIEKEKGVIIDEINSYRDNPDEMLMDEFEEKLFPAHPLGKSILGSEGRVKTFQREDLIAFINRNYGTDQIVFACLGNVSAKKIHSFCRKLELIPTRRGAQFKRDQPAQGYFNMSKVEKVHQVHALIGCPTIGFNDDRRRAMVLMNNVLGGPALNSRLNLNIREKFGYCYYIESSYAPYSDCGIFQIYFGTDHSHQNRVEKLINKELNWLMQNPLSDRTMHAAKKQLLGQIALAQENRSNFMLALGKSLLNFDRIDSFKEVLEEVESITSDEVQLLAQETFGDNKLSYLSYSPG